MRDACLWHHAFFSTLYSTADFAKKGLGPSLGLIMRLIGSPPYRLSALRSPATRHITRWHDASPMSKKRCFNHCQSPYIHYTTYTTRPKAYTYTASEITTYIAWSEKSHHILLRTAKLNNHCDIIVNWISSSQCVMHATKEIVIFVYSMQHTQCSAPSSTKKSLIQNAQKTLNKHQ